MATQFRQGLKKVYLPNVVFRMFRAPNLQPNQVAFKVPPNCNKFDIHSYLTNIYQVNVQEVRTMNYATAHKKGRNGKVEVNKSAYKKAIVTLDQPFSWPTPPDWCELEMEQRKIGQTTFSGKTKGWRFRGTEDERARSKDVNQRLQAKAEADQKK